MKTNIQERNSGRSQSVEEIFEINSTRLQKVITGSDSKSPSPKKSDRSRPVKSTVTVASPKGGMRLRTPAGQPVVADPQYQSLNDASKHESSKKDSLETPDTPDNSSR
ncbi:hypothetical protein PRIPAC_86199 [Pristionchus pacificus]|uniref:Uncharacterized protein n=1 Tax=Pristionchus pacificus TaxID=54126 RepID=A0A454XYY3_PRIPA|nr:hypothetical protein PRIPAC_86199 [Pristionchus pacificus]|eukprot:PDM65083.1 hypothetical protein PRIPAC_53332 [Pristionchus pacificus]